MAEDLATSLANAIGRAIGRSGPHSDWPRDRVSALLAEELRQLLPACYFCHALARTLEAGYAVCEPMFHAGQRERLEDVPPAATVGTPWHESMPGYSAPDWTPDERHRHTIGGQTWEHAHEGGHEAHSAVSHDLSGAERVPGPAGYAHGFSVFSAPVPSSGDVLERSTCRHCSVPVVLLHVEGGTPIWNHERGRRRYAPCSEEKWRLPVGGMGQRERYIALGGTWAEPTTEEARPALPSAVADALDAARVLLNWLKNVKAAEFAGAERQALARALAAVDEADEAERTRRYALGEEHGAMGGSL